MPERSRQTKSGRAGSGTASKLPTGILGFDEMTGGGLPEGRTTLLVGGPGSGKTIFALQFLVHGASMRNEPGIFVAFEENSARIAGNARSFGWGLEKLPDDRLYFVDAQPTPDLVQLGNFDLDGMLALLDYQIKAIGARRIVFDALDIVLRLMPDQASREREIYRLHEWLLGHGVTGVITLKDDSGDSSGAGNRHAYGFMQFMVDCAVILNHGISLGVSQRNVRVLKYRGSDFDENESPFMISRGGIEVGFARVLNRRDIEVTRERVSTGVAALDAMLEGGYYRRSCVLITGTPGTGKSTFGASFAAAACSRGERTLLVSFDSDGSEVIRNMASVGINLARHVKSGMLSMKSARSIIGSAGAHLVRIKALAKEHAARCVVIDPVSTLSKSASELNAHSVAELLIDWAKSENIDLLCTSLTGDLTTRISETPVPLLATLADTLIHLDHPLVGTRRKRYLSIIKSRGTAHSQALLELILSSRGLTLSPSGGEDERDPGHPPPSGNAKTNLRPRGRANTERRRAPAQ